VEDLLLAPKRDGPAGAGPSQSSKRDGRLVVVVVVIITVIVMTPVAVVAVVAVIVVIPVALFHTPTVVFADVVVGGPVGAAIGRPIPVTAHPAVTIAVVAPVAIDPDEAVAGHGGTHLNTDGRRRRTDVDMNLAESGCS
jgi:hypothetical protein